MFPISLQKTDNTSTDLAEIINRESVMLLTEMKNGVSFSYKGTDFKKVEDVYINPHNLEHHILIPNPITTSNKPTYFQSYIWEFITNTSTDPVNIMEVTQESTSEESKKDMIGFERNTSSMIPVQMDLSNTKEGHLVSNDIHIVVRIEMCELYGTPTDSYRTIGHLQQELTKAFNCQIKSRNSSFIQDFVFDWEINMNFQRSYVEMHLLKNLLSSDSLYDFSNNGHLSLGKMIDISSALTCYKQHPDTASIRELFQILKTAGNKLSHYNNASEDAFNSKGMESAITYIKTNNQELGDSLASTLFELENFNNWATSQANDPIFTTSVASKIYTMSWGFILSCAAALFSELPKFEIGLENCPKHNLWVNEEIPEWEILPKTVKDVFRGDPVVRHLRKTKGSEYSELWETHPETRRSIVSRENWFDCTEIH